MNLDKNSRPSIQLTISHHLIITLTDKFSSHKKFVTLGYLMREPCVWCRLGVHRQTAPPSNLSGHSRIKLSSGQQLLITLKSDRRGQGSYFPQPKLQKFTVSPAPTVTRWSNLMAIGCSHTDQNKLHAEIFCAGSAQHQVTLHRKPQYERRPAKLKKGCINAL